MSFKMFLVSSLFYTYLSEFYGICGVCIGAFNSAAVPNIAQKAANMLKFATQRMNKINFIEGRHLFR